MYKIIKNVAQEGKFELSDLLKKIDTFWVKGNITDEQRTELQKLAQDKANPQNSVDVLQKLEEMDKRIKTLEAIINAGNDTEPDVEGEGETPAVEEYPAFVVGKWYYGGDKITFEGNKYICIAPEGSVCVWNPTDYPAYWEKSE